MRYWNRIVLPVSMLMLFGVLIWGYKHYRPSRATAAAVPVATTAPAPQVSPELVLQTIAQWEDWIKANPGSSSRTLRCPYYQQLIGYGPSAVPTIIQYLQKHPGAASLVGVVAYSTGRTFSTINDPEGPRREYANALQWWTLDRSNFQAEFEAAYADYQQKKAEAIAKGDVVRGQPILWKKTLACTVTGVLREYDREEMTPFGRAYLNMRGLGIDILPLIIEQLRQGNVDLLPVFRELTKGQGALSDGQGGTLQDRIQFTLDWWEKNKTAWTLPPPETPAAKANE